MRIRTTKCTENLKIHNLAVSYMRIEPWLSTEKLVKQDISGSCNSIRQLTYKIAVDSLI